jgi:hypothetical protein
MSDPTIDSLRKEIELDGQVYLQSLTSRTLA